jgi:hypothetical protein
MNRTLVFLLLAVVPLVVGSCGGSAPATSDPVPQPQPEFARAVLASTVTLDGLVRSDGVFQTDTGEGLQVTGDLDGVTNGLGVRQFFSFDLSAIPPGATIAYAMVSFQQIDRVGTPYHTHGSVRFEHVEYGSALDPTDYDVPTLWDAGGLIAYNSTTSGRALGVTDAVQEDLDLGRGRSQWRIRFELADSDSDDVSDYTVWVNAELLVEYNY